MSESFQFSDDPGYRRLVTPKGNIVRMQESEIDVPACDVHPEECIDTIKRGIWIGTTFCTKCRTVIKVNESSWKDHPIETEEPKHE